MQYCKTIKVRARAIKGGMMSLYLDYYPGYRDNVTMKTIRHESLGIYIYENPQTRHDKEYNKAMKEKAEAIRCRRFEAAVDGRFDFFNKYNGDFLDYFNQVLQNKDPKWKFVYEHFYHFIGGRCRCEEVDIDLCNKFRDYLMTAKNLRNGKPMAINSVAGYWSTFRAFLNIAYLTSMTFLIKSRQFPFISKVCH